MGEKLIIGPINKGLKTDRLPFNIDNDSFPKLVNAYQWRGRVKRKRGVRLLNRLQRSITISIALTLNAGQDAILPNFPIVPGTINLVGSTDGTTYTDPARNGILVATGGTGTGGTINYSTGLIHINAGGGETLTGTISYYPVLPVMGLEDLALTSTQFPGLLAFDTTFSYEVPTTTPYTPKDVSFYKNPIANPVTLPGYIQKLIQTPTTWNGQTYQQFWSTNYLGAFWATNGITVPFNRTNIGMQFSLVTAIAIVDPTTVNITVTGPNLIVGDFVFLNEFDPLIVTGVNFQTGYVIAGTAPGIITVRLPFANVLGAGGLTTSGIVQYLTNRSDPTKDSLRWYDGDPTLNSGVHGWVNFAPPLSKSDYSISGLVPDQYYLVGARMIVPFKDRLLFLGCVVQTSATDSQIYLQDTVVYSQNGTPYYTVSFTDGTTNYGINPTIGYNPILVPDNQTSTPFSYFADNTGFGGFVSAGVDQPITTSGSNEDALIIGFSTVQTRFIYTGNDIIPFNFYLINSELGSASTFSTINMDEGIITRGTRGFIITGQTSAKRFDTEILDQVFEISLQNNGNERLCSQRDFINEWIYFTYISNKTNSNDYIYPNQTLQYNYRDQSWGIFNETYTTYGQFRKQTGDTWLTIDVSWDSWNQPWEDGETTLLQSDVIAGNQQGFILEKDSGTEEDTSLFIQSFTGSTITSPDHGLNNGDYIIITGALGTIGTQVNKKIFQVRSALENTFVLSPPIGTGTYLGGGLIIRLYVPIILSKQFPEAWNIGRKTRIGVQQYLFTKTPAGRIQLLIFLSQDSDSAFNDNLFIPIDDTIYSTLIYTCPESTNLGLTPSNVNLQIPIASTQQQIWHRLNTSLIGDTVQFGITLSDEQMRQFIASSQEPFIITGITQAYPAVITVNNSIGIGSRVQITGVLGMTQINNILNLANPIYEVVARTDSNISLNVDSTGFTTYDSGGIVTVMEMPNQQAEIEFHGAIIDVSGSSMLV